MTSLSKLEDDTDTRVVSRVSGEGVEIFDRGAVARASQAKVTPASGVRVRPSKRRRSPSTVPPAAAKPSGKGSRALVFALLGGLAIALAGAGGAWAGRLAKTRLDGQRAALVVAPEVATHEPREAVTREVEIAKAPQAPAAERVTAAAVIPTLSIDDLDDDAPKARGAGKARSARK